ncbi:MAG: NUDIX domain-containing protein [Candidatus Paceibacterota bacterium]|jgi:8-oxo-dGTP diphosphatase
MENNKEKRQIMVAIGAIRDNQGRILLQKRIDPLIPDAHEKWEFPGGRIDFGETPEDALLREVKEEVDCEVKILRLLPSVQSAVWTRTDGKIQHVLISCFEAELLSGTPKPADKKVSEVRWYKKEEIDALDTLKGIKDFIKLLW